MPGTTDPVYMGNGSALGIAQEVTWGTAVSPRTNFLPLVSHNLRHNVEYADIPDLGVQGQASNNVRRRYKGLESAGGDIEWVGAYDDSTVWLLKQALGACVDAGGPAYTHTITLATELGEGLTLEVGRGNLPTSAPLSEVFEGCLINRLEMSWKPGDVLRCKATIIAETSAARASASTPTYHTGFGEPIIGWQGTALTWNAVARKLRDLTITVDNKLDARPALGTASTLRPQRTGPVEVIAKATLEILTGDALQTAYLAQTQADGTITFTSGTKSLAITLQNAEIVSIDDPISTAGVLTQTVTWRCLSDGTDEGLKLVMTNGNALYSTN